MVTVAAPRPRRIHLPSAGFAAEGAGKTGALRPGAVLLFHDHVLLKNVCPFGRNAVYAQASRSAHTLRRKCTLFHIQFSLPYTVLGAAKRTPGQ